MKSKVSFCRAVREEGADATRKRDDAAEKIEDNGSDAIKDLSEGAKGYAARFRTVCVCLCVMECVGPTMRLGLLGAFLLRALNESRSYNHAPFEAFAARSAVRGAG